MEKLILTPIVIEGIANVLGDTAEGLTGTEIHNILLQSHIEDVDPTNTKRIRLYNDRCTAKLKHFNSKRLNSCGQPYYNSPGGYLQLAGHRAAIRHYKSYTADHKQRLKNSGYIANEI